MSTPAAAAPKQKVIVATVAVFLGAGIVSLYQRLLSVGLPDLRGALGLGLDEAAWIPTAYNMALMFMGAFTVYLGALLGRRKILLVAGAIFTLVSIMLPFSPGLRSMLVLQVIAGLASGTFYPLALSYALRSLPPHYIIYAIGAYSMELISTLSIGTPLQGWYSEHLSWHWIFWTSAVLVPIMMLCVHRGIPPQSEAEGTGPRPKVSWIGLLSASLGLSALDAVLEQGERLNWLDSGTIAALLAVGAFLLLVAIVRRWRSPNPLVDLAFLAQRNTLILGGGLFMIRFVLLAVVFLIPGYLGAVQGFRPVETGRVLLWVAPPVLIFGYIAARIMRRVDGRVVAAFAFATIAAACLMNARLSSDWAQDQFFWPQLVLALGLATTFVGVIGLIATQAIESGAVTSPAKVLTYGAFFQTMRLFGGQVGVTALQHFIVVRSRFHTQILGASVEAGRYLTEDHLRTLAAGLAPGSGSVDEAQARVIGSVGGQLARQVTTLSYMDGFILVACACAGMVLLLALMKPMRVLFGPPKAVPARQR